jgi:hypothetical protein
MTTADRIVVVTLISILALVGLMSINVVSRIEHEVKRAHSEVEIARASEAEAWRLVQELRATLAQYQEP